MQMPAKKYPLEPQLLDALEMSLQHRKCADIHERACRHFREAARLYELNDLAQGAIHSSIARGHASLALKTDTFRTASD